VLDYAFLLLALSSGALGFLGAGMGGASVGIALGFALGIVIVARFAR